MLVLLGLLIGTCGGLIWLRIAGLRVREWDVPPYCHTLRGWNRFTRSTVCLWPVVMLAQLFLPDPKAMLRTTGSVSGWSLVFAAAGCLTGWMWARCLVLAISSKAREQAHRVLQERESPARTTQAQQPMKP